MGQIKLLNETDLKMQFKTNTGHYVNIDSLGLNEKQYLLFLEEQLLEYQNAELVVNQANIEANTVVREDQKEKCGECVNCTCDE